MIPNFEEEVEHVGENIFESRVSIDMNPSLINIPDDFKDDKEDKEGSYHELATKKFMTGASEVVFSEATVLAETFAYHKLMGPESSGRVRGVGSGVTSNQLIGKRNCQSGTEPSDSSIVSLLLKEVQSLRQEGDDVEENQRNNTPLAGEPMRDTLILVPTSAKNNEAYIKGAAQIENTTVLRDKGGAAHTSSQIHFKELTSPVQSNRQETYYCDK
ncbi:hypothetical protein Cgig2_015274 [Carnegiea gigantea]|uniref:Uncharacterized protein n=1 Tax=Carnegiea gigantea TaxID=171969 RepID=A0A9Q1K8M3_9CARY|nr:hypothetical protein Cgig2_015274 [Carnegiea gigantea]